MTGADWTTADLAAEVRQTAHANPDVADCIRPAAVNFVRSITTRLPDIDPADIAAVLLHVSCYLNETLAIFRAQGGVPPEVRATSAVNIVALAGEQMHRNATRGDS